MLEFYESWSLFRRCLAITKDFGRVFQNSAHVSCTAAYHARHFQDWSSQKHWEAINFRGGHFWTLMDIDLHYSLCKFQEVSSDSQRCYPEILDSTNHVYLIEQADSPVSVLCHCPPHLQELTVRAVVYVENRFVTPTGSKSYLPATAGIINLLQHLILDININHGLRRSGRQVCMHMPYLCRSYGPQSSYWLAVDGRVLDYLRDRAWNHGNQTGIPDISILKRL